MSAKTIIALIEAAKVAAFIYVKFGGEFMIIYSGSGSGNSVVALPQYATKLNLVNDGATPLTVTVGNIPVTVLGLEQFNGDFAPFNAMNITSAGQWRFVVEDDDSAGMDNESYTRITDLMQRIRERITDKDAIEFENVELVGYLNDAIDWLSLQLIQIKSSEMVKESEVSDGDSIPAGYQSSCGVFPIMITSNKIRIIDDSNTIILRYFATKPHITYVIGSDGYYPIYSPFGQLYDSILVQKTAIFAWDRDQYDVSQDEKLLAQSLQAVGVIAGA